MGVDLICLMKVDAMKCQRVVSLSRSVMMMMFAMHFPFGLAQEARDHEARTFPRESVW
jgi:hypothetical protein